MINDLTILQTSNFTQMLRQCIHCGMCLQACPTYNVFGTEVDGPRGRIALIRAASEGKLSLGEVQNTLSRHILLCLACRSCETACPSGVKYGAIIEATRILVEHNRKPGIPERFLRWLGIKQLMPNLWLLKLLARILRLYEVIGLQHLVRKLNTLPATLNSMETILPDITLNYINPKKCFPPSGQKRGTLSFFTGCIQEAFLANVNQATLRVLQKNGYEILIPSKQVCCGAAHLHLGDKDGAQQLARVNIDAFLSLNCDSIICNAGGCGVCLKEYPQLLADDPIYFQRAQEFSLKIKDISEFLVDHLSVPPLGIVKARTVYSDSCHLRHGQKVIKPPRQLLKMVPGIQLVELSLPDRCCGSAGVYNIAHVEVANAILDTKMADIANTGAELIITSNTGCHMQLLAGVRRAGLKAKVMHAVEVIDLSYRNNNQYS